MTKDQVRSTEETLKLALDALESIKKDLYPDAYAWELVDTPITAIKQALAAPVISAGPITPAMQEGPTPEQREKLVQAMKSAYSAAPVQEPVAIVSGYYGGQCVILPTDPARLFSSGTAFYTTPPAAQRQWVGLTDDEIKAVIAKIDPNEHYLPNALRQLSLALEAKLKEKNSD